MFKFTLTKSDGRKLIGFGITAENVDRLKKGQPILVDLREMGVDTDITIFYGATEQDVYKQVEPMIGDETRMRTDENRAITPEEKMALKASGYLVKKTKHGWYPIKPHGGAILRGWTKTEDEAWWFCQKHYEQKTRN